MSEIATKVRTHCKICTNQCGVVAEVQDNEIIRLKGDFDHPLSKGYTCPKGRALGKNHHHPKALTRPMMRKEGNLVPVSWDECLDDLAQKLTSVIDRHGPGATGIFLGSGLGMDAAGFRMGEALHRAIGTPAKFSPMTIDGAAKVLVHSLVGGFPGLSGKTDYENVEMLIYVGVNPMVSHGHNSGMFNPPGPIRAATARGGEIWTIDPLRTHTAKFSTRHIAPYPGKDYAILAWLTREILEGGPLNPAQPIVGLEVLRAALADLDRKTAAKIAGVSEEELADLLDAVRRKGSCVVETGTGLSMTSTANLTQWFAWLLPILTGKMNRPGGMWFHPGFTIQYDSFELPLMDNPFTPGPPTMPNVSGLIGDWPCAAVPGEIEAGNMHAFINLGGSMVRSFPDANVLIPALRKLEVFASLEVVENETTALSTHILPTKDQVERPDISLWDTLSASLSMLYSPQVVEPMGERRSAWWILSQLMDRMGLHVPDHVPQDDREDGADHAMLAPLLTGARCGFDTLVDAGQVALPMDLPAKWVDDHIERIGGWRLAPEKLVQLWHEMRRADQTAPVPPLSFIPRRQRRKLNASLSFLGSPADIILHPDDAAANSITHGEPVRVKSSRGEITLTANVSDEIRPGVTSIPHGHESANVNLLTSIEHVDPMTGMVRYSGIPIEVEPLQSSSSPRDQDTEIRIGAER